MKQYDIEVIHEPSGAYLTYTVFTEEEDVDHYKDFIRDISIVVTNEEEVDELDTIDLI